MNMNNKISLKNKIILLVEVTILIILICFCLLPIFQTNESENNNDNNENETSNTPTSNSLAINVEKKYYVVEVDQNFTTEQLTCSFNNEDIDNNDVNYSIGSDITGSNILINNGDGVITGKIDHVVSFNLLINATYNENVATAYITFSIINNFLIIENNTSSPPILIEATIGTPIAATMPLSVIDNINNTAINTPRYSSNRSMPTGLNLDEDTGVISGTVDHYDESFKGIYSIKVIDVDNPKRLSDYITFEIKIISVIV